MHTGKPYFRLPLTARPGQQQVKDVVAGKFLIDMTSYKKPDPIIDGKIQRIVKTYCGPELFYPSWPFMAYIHLNNGTWHGHKSNFSSCVVVGIDEIPYA